MNRKFLKIALKDQRFRVSDLGFGEPYSGFYVEYCEKLPVQLSGWVVVKELILSYNNKETPLLRTYPYCGNLISQFLNRNPAGQGSGFEA